MDIDEAQSIVSRYGELYSNPLEGNAKLVRPITDLPCSPAKVKYAFFTLTDHLIKNGQLPEEKAEALKSTYAAINTAFREEAQEINKKFKNFLKDLQNKSMNRKGLKQFKEDFNLQSGMWPSMPSLEDQVEFHNFIADCQGNY